MNVGVDRIWVHPDYDEYSANKFHDIAVIRMKKSVPFTHFITPICLPHSYLDNPLREGQMFSVSGWGRTDLCEVFVLLLMIHVVIKLYCSQQILPQHKVAHQTEDKNPFCSHCHL